MNPRIKADLWGLLLLCLVLAFGGVLLSACSHTARETLWGSDPSTNGSIITPATPGLVLPLATNVAGALPLLVQVHMPEAPVQGFVSQITSGLLGALGVYAAGQRKKLQQKAAR